MTQKISRDHGLHALLTKKELRLTKQRKLILDYLHTGETHPTAEAIYQSLNRKFPFIGRATVFRTLKLFEDVGLCQRMSERSRFEPGAGRNHHDHMICLRCGLVLEFSNDTIEKLQRREASRRGFTLVRHALEIMGYCKRCRKKAKA